MALIQRWPAVSAYLFGRGAEVEVRVVMSISLSGADENRASLEGSRRWMGLYMGLDKSSLLLYQPSSSSLLQALLHQPSFIFLHHSQVMIALEFKCFWTVSLSSHLERMWEYKTDSGHKAAITSGSVGRAKMAASVVTGSQLSIRVLARPTNLTSPDKKPHKHYQINPTYDACKSVMAKQ